MLTQIENQAARTRAADFFAAVTAYKAFLTSHELPLSLDTTKLLDIYRGRLFEQLLAADTGLKARYDMARTKEGKQRIQVDTMAGISLTGHEYVEQLSEVRNALQHAHQSLPKLGDLGSIDLADLLQEYELDYGRYLDQVTISWESKEHARAYFEKVGEVLTEWRDLAKTDTSSELKLSQVIDFITWTFSGNIPQYGPITMNEKALHSFLKYRPKLVEALAQKGAQGSN